MGTFLSGHTVGKGGKVQRKRTSEGLTENLQKSKMLWLRKLRRRLDTSPDYPTFPWIDTSKGNRDSINQYYKTIDEVNESYRIMLEMEKGEHYFPNPKKKVKIMLTAKTKEEYRKVRKI